MLAWLVELDAPYIDPILYVDAANGTIVGGFGAGVPDTPTPVPTIAPTPTPAV
jgi:hypothetical protein